MKLRGTLNKRDDEDKGWSVEGRIPWTDFLRTGGRPEPGEEWKLNLCRFDYHTDWKDPELSCVAPIAKKKIAAVLPPDRGLRRRSRSSARTRHREAVRHREARAADDVARWSASPTRRRRSVARAALAELPARVPDHAWRRSRARPRCSLITQPRSYGPTHASAASRTTPAATDKDAVKLFDTPDERHRLRHLRSTRSSRRTATSTSAGTAQPEGQKRKCARSPATR